MERSSRESVTDAEKREAVEVMKSLLYAHEQFTHVPAQVLKKVKSMKAEKTENGGVGSHTLKNDGKITENAKKSGGVAVKTDEKQDEKAEKGGGVALKTDGKQAEKAEKGGSVALKTDEKGGGVAETFRFEQPESDSESLSNLSDTHESEDSSLLSGSDSWDVPLPPME